MNRTLIVVDDEKDIVQAYIDFLQPAPEAAPRKSSRSAVAPIAETPRADVYEILTANSGEEALAKVKEQLNAGKRVAGGFFDVKMEGGMDGIQAIQEIWKVDPNLHCTIVTAYQDRSVQDIDRLFSGQFGDMVKDQWDYLNKPFNQAEITQKARQMIASWNRKRALEKALDDLKISQEKLIQSERLAAIGQVARGVGHEFGNILQRIVGKCDLSLRMKEVEKLHENFKLVLQASERASMIVRNLQSFSKTAGDRTLVDMSQVIQDTILLINHEFKTSSIDYVDKREKVSAVHANPIEIQQVFMNLIINAMHATPKGGKIEVGCKENAGKIVVWVADTGSGISHEVLPKIFEYAFTTKGDKGSGLGLSISKQILDNHQASITVDSKVGAGTKFMLEFNKANK